MSHYVAAVVVLIALSSHRLWAQPVERNPDSAGDPAAPAQLPPRGQKRVVPTENEQAKIAKLLRDMYGKQLAQAKTPAQKSELAKELLAEAARNTDSPVDRYVVLFVAASVGAKAGDLEATRTAIHELDDGYLVDVLTLKADALLALGSASRLTGPVSETGEFVRDLLNDAASADRYELIEEVGSKAITAVKRSKNPSLIRDVTRIVGEAKRAEQAFAELHQTLANVARDPEDQAANLIVGQYYAFRKGDWSSGLPHLSRCGEQQVMNLAKLELGDPQETERWIELGDGWATMAKTEKDNRARHNMNLHAISCYQRAVNQLSGFTMLTVKSRMDKLRAEVLADRQ